MYPAPRVNYLNAAYGVRSWLLTRDHKRIALLYLASVTVFFFLGLLTLLGLLLLGAPRLARKFRVPAHTWLPLGFISPIEQPG